MAISSKCIDILHLKGFSGAKFQGFATKQEAIQYVKDECESDDDKQKLLAQLGCLVKVSAWTLKNIQPLF